MIFISFDDQSFDLGRHRLLINADGTVDPVDITLERGGKELQVVIKFDRVAERRYIVSMIADIPLQWNAEWHLFIADALAKYVMDYGVIGFLQNQICAYTFDVSDATPSGRGEEIDAKLFKEPINEGFHSTFSEAVAEAPASETFDEYHERIFGELESLGAVMHRLPAIDYSQARNDVPAIIFEWDNLYFIVNGEIYESGRAVTCVEGDVSFPAIFMHENIMVTCDVPTGACIDMSDLKAGEFEALLTNYASIFQMSMDGSLYNEVIGRERRINHLLEGKRMTRSSLDANRRRSRPRGAYGGNRRPGGYRG